MADQFVLVRLVNMRGVDLNVFDFDFDLTWSAFFMNADDHIYGRYGSRDEGSAESGLSLKGLKYAMRQALGAYSRNPSVKPKSGFAETAGLPTRPEKYPAAKRLKAKSCIHCHQVHNFQTRLAWSKKEWTKDKMWLFPPAKNVGVTLDVEQGDKVKSVIAASAAAKAGLQRGDVLSSINGVPTASQADVRYGLNRAPIAGKITVHWKRDGREMSGTLALKKGWRKSDISWRAAMWTMPPAFGMYGKNLTVAEKRELGLGPNRLAFRQGKYVPRKTRQAGIRGRDIIVGINGKELQMTMLQFNVYVRTYFNVGDRVVFDVIRGRKRLKVKMVLPVRPAN